MSRKLDALFAERVLGCKVDWVRDTPECGCEETVHGDWDNCCEFHRDYIKFYTTSLDAAWEGVRPALDGPWITGPAHMSLWTEGMTLGRGECRAKFGTPCGRWGVEAKADHPALAIVLACLRAVGVTEEEISAAS